MAHAVVSDEEWLVARKELLEKRRVVAKAYEDLWKERAALPWRKVVADYVLERASDGAKVKLSELFEGGKSDLIIIHMMFDTDWDNACAFCSFWADGYSGQLPHLGQVVNFAVVAKAAPEKLRALAESKGWTFPFYSSQHSSFNSDFGAECSAAEVAAKAPVYNYGRAPYATQGQGASVFHKSAGDATVYHTYSTFARGIEFMNVAMTLLDLTPRGRYGDAQFVYWAKHKELYGQDEKSGVKRKAHE